MPKKSNEATAVAAEKKTEQCEVRTLIRVVNGIEQPILSCYGDDEDLDTKFDTAKAQAVREYGTDTKFRIESDKKRERWPTS